MDSLRALCPRGALSSCTQRPPVHTWHLASCSSDRNKRPLKERSNASFEKHRVLLQAPRLKKGNVSQKKDGEKKRCQSYQSRARMCESLGKRRDCVVSKRPVGGFLGWDNEARGQTVAPVWCKMSQTTLCSHNRRSGAKNKVGSKSDHAAQIITASDFLLMLMNHNNSHGLDKPW